MQEKPLAQHDWERLIFGEPVVGVEQIQERYLRRFREGRQAAKALLATSEGLFTLKDMYNLIESKRSYLMEQDTSFNVDLCVLEWASKNGGRLKLEEELLATLPSEGCLDDG
eukprot:3685630-Amphidinium_carterae.1